MKKALKSLLLTTHTYRPVRRLRERLPTSRRHLDGVRRLYSRFVAPGDLCFDIGANIGRRSASLLELGAEVVAAEPNPAVYRELIAYLSGNPRFHPVPSAIGSTPGRAILQIAKEPGLSTLNRDWWGGHLETTGQVEVEVTTLDALIERYGVPTFLKIDVEGYELEALKGLSRSIRTVSYEYNGDFLDQAVGCLDRLREFGPIWANATRGEDVDFLGPWRDYESFRRVLMEELPRHPTTCWGDVFVSGVAIP
jgi:FkbM family methyltransferase